MKRPSTSRMDVSDDGFEHTRVGRSSSASQLRAYAVNAQYAALQYEDHICVKDLESNTTRLKFPISSSGRRSGLKPAVLVYSPAADFLAYGSASQALIYDLEARRVVCTLRGTGHTVSALAFAPSASGVVASGHATGSICIWSLQSPSQPLYNVQGSAGACLAVAVHPRNANIIAGCHKGRLSIWRLPNPRPITISNLEHAGIALLKWASGPGDRIVCISYSGTITLSEVQHSLSSKSSRLELDRAEIDVETDLYGTLDGLDNPASVSAHLGFSLTQACLLGDHGLVVLAANSTVLHFLAYSLDGEAPTELWRLVLDSSATCFSVRLVQDAVEVLLSFAQQVQLIDVPQPVLDSMGWPEHGPLTSTHLLLENGRVDAGIHHKPSMRPEKPQRRPPQQVRRPKPHIDIARRVVASKLNVKQSLKEESRLFREDSGVLDDPAQNTMMSSLKSLKLEENGNSPMPFLSPTIPARKTLPVTIPALDDSIQLPPRASFDSMSLAATHGQESDDSDDETLPEHMQSSGTYLPGGLNVPLPRTCGATFSLNGDLLTFFPSRPKSLPIVDGHERKEKDVNLSQSSEALSLFPSFGNLRTPLTGRYNVEYGSADSIENTFNRTPLFAFQASSFDSRPSWPTKVSPVKPSPGTLPGPHGNRVQVHHAEDFTPTRNRLAQTYRLLPDETKSDAYLCHENAKLAANESLHETAHIWQLLALMLESKQLHATVDGSGTHNLEEKGVIGRPLPSRLPSWSSTLSRAVDDHALSSHPYSSSEAWAIERLIAEAEQMADLQLLACLSAFLFRNFVNHCGHEASFKSTNKHIDERSDSNTGYLDTTRIPPRVPVLRPGDSDSKSYSDSPRKPHSSRASSRNLSQPTTQHLENASSIPTMALPRLSRQRSSRLPLSGSASPEHHRSSFSAAARNYAASIAEKFGSSPPTKKLSVSPGNELSSSLPAGSLGKSVSFASTIDGTEASQRSLSLAQEDDDYDSDRTIDDGSLPRTPQGRHSGFSYKGKQTDFFDETSTSIVGPRLSDIIAAKGRIWLQYYAEQLRSWDMLLEAAELQNIASIRHGLCPPANVSNDFISPVALSDRGRAMCNVCFCIIHAAEQVCPACLHTSHPHCLEQFATALDDMAFTCPSGCGCDCSANSDLAFSLEEDDEKFDHHDTPAHSLFPKKPSLTDPLRLRQRLQGESW